MDYAPVPVALTPLALIALEGLLQDPDTFERFEDQLVDAGVPEEERERAAESAAAEIRRAINRALAAPTRRAEPDVHLRHVLRHGRLYIDGKTYRHQLLAEMAGKQVACRYTTAPDGRPAVDVQTLAGAPVCVAPLVHSVVHSPLAA